MSGSLVGALGSVGACTPGEPRGLTDGAPKSVSLPLQGPRATNWVAAYNVSFVETGLPAGAFWIVDLNWTGPSTTYNATINSTVDSMSLYEPNGTYTYFVGNVSGFVAQDNSGNVTVNGTGVTVSVSFVPTPPAPSSALTGQELDVVLVLLTVLGISWVAVTILLLVRKRGPGSSTLTGEESSPQPVQREP